MRFDLCPGELDPAVALYDRRTQRLVHLSGVEGPVQRAQLVFRHRLELGFVLAVELLLERYFVDRLDRHLDCAIVVVVVVVVVGNVPTRTRMGGCVVMCCVA